ncbi:hypothetical protein AJ88_28735 [Mesorhizobium amorphae CCBAU 01583]|nr:hypothetical protein AJ88_28735 [Mesorhizobium amorphae CCBAU 01583]
MAIGFAVGGEPGSRLSGRLAMPVSGDTLLRMIRAAGFEPPEAPRVVGIDDWAWRKGSATERSSAIWSATASWIYCRIEMPTRSHHGWDAILPSRSSLAIVTASMLRARSGAPTLRRSPTAGIFFRTWAKRCVWLWDAIVKLSAPLGTGSKMAGNNDARPSPRLDCLRRSRGVAGGGLSPRPIAPRIGMNVRTVER